MEDLEKQYKYVLKFNYEVEQYPSIRNFYEKKFIDYLLRTFPWYKCEEFVYN